MQTTEAFTIARRQFMLAAAGACASVRVAAQNGALIAERPTIKVGDRWKYEQRDRRTQALERSFVRVVTAVTPTAIEYTEDGTKALMTPDFTVLESPTHTAESQASYFAFPMQVGKAWTYAEKARSKANPLSWSLKFDASVGAIERVQVPAGTFDALRIEYAGISAWNSGGNAGTNAIRAVVCTPRRHAMP